MVESLNKQAEEQMKEAEKQLSATDTPTPTLLD